MGDRSEKMAELLDLMEEHTPQDGVFPTGIDNLFTFRASQPSQRTPQVYEPGIIIGVQGRKNIYLEGRRYDYCAGDFLATFVPMSVECEIPDVTPEKPLIGAGIIIDLNRIARLLLKMDIVERPPVKPEEMDASGIFSGTIKDNLLDAAIRLFKTLSSRSEAAVLGEAIIDEIYFRILIEEQGGTLKYLLQQHGQIRQIAKAVEYVHRNLDKPISVDDMADIVNMSSSGFHKKFKEVMHLSPLQYAKSIKLSRAQAYIMEGKSVSEAGYMVGYSSPAQFSREYKRHFGVVPSAT
jgi:AraC-like DNA-binding protein